MKNAEYYLAVVAAAGAILLVLSSVTLADNGTFSLDNFSKLKQAWSCAFLMGTVFMRGLSIIDEDCQ